MEQKTNGYLSVKDVVDLLQVHENTVYAWLTSGELPGIKIGDRWRIRKSDIDALFEKQKATTNDTAKTA